MSQKSDVKKSLCSSNCQLETLEIPTLQFKYSLNHKCQLNVAPNQKITERRRIHPLEDMKVGTKCLDQSGDKRTDIIMLLKYAKNKKKNSCNM